MKECQLRCSDDEVRAILDGLQTQVRRPVPEKWIPIVEEVLRVNGKWTPNTLGYDLTSPFGGPGDRLWIRETWRCHQDDIDDPLELNFRADDTVQYIDPDSVQFEKYNDWKWRPSTNMPRWASRITLEVLDVRVELDDNPWVWVGTFRKLNDNTKGKTR